MLEFPAYRKIENIEVYFKITDENTFTELKKMGGFYFEEEFTAKIYPDKVRIQEMLQAEKTFQKINQHEYELIHAEWTKNLVKSSF